MVERAVKGDETALTMLLLGTQAWLGESIARRIPADLRGSIDADDVVQEAHVSAACHISELESTDSQVFNGWISAIAQHKLRDLIRRRRAAKRGGGQVRMTPPAANLEDSMVQLLDVIAGPGRTPSRCVGRAEAVGYMQRALADLPEHYFEAIRLVHLEGRAVADAAREMDRTERAVHGLLRRGLETLRNQLGTASDYLSSQR